MIVWARPLMASSLFSASMQGLRFSATPPLLVRPFISLRNLCAAIASPSIALPYRTPRTDRGWAGPYPGMSTGAVCIVSSVPSDSYETMSTSCKLEVKLKVGLELGRLSPPPAALPCPIAGGALQTARSLRLPPALMGVCEERQFWRIILAERLGNCVISGRQQ